MSHWSERLILVQTGANVGFAGGNNVGLRLVMADAETEFAWLLNNDTVVDPDALAHLVRRMEEKPEAGICGSTLLYYGAPDMVQALAGSTYNRWIARIGQIGLGMNAMDLPPAEDIEYRLQYVAGASMLLRRELLETVGLLEEQYFLYFEEIDLAIRAHSKYALAYAPESRVYHKEGASIGTARLASRRSSMSEYYSTRNRLLFTRKYARAAFPTVVLAVGMSGLQRALTGKWSNFSAVLRGLVSGFEKRLGAS